MEEAKAILGEALEIRKEKLAEEHPMTGAVHNNLAVVMSMTGQNKDGKDHCLKAIAIKEKSGGSGCEFDIGAMHRNLARMQRKLKDLDGVRYSINITC